MTITTRVGINGLPPTAEVTGGSTLIGARIGIAGLPTSSGGGGNGGGGTTDPTPVNPLPITLSSPEDQLIIPSSRPQFMVAVTSGELTATYQMIIQYAADAAMTSPSTLTATFTAVDGGVVVSPSSDVPALTYWRARVAQDAVWRSAWTNTFSFTVATIGAPGSLGVAWHVDYALDRDIHLWHLVPPVASAGETITAYGQGFPDPGQGKIVFDGTALQVTRWVRHVPSGAASATRTIDADTVDPEHYEVDFTAPDYDGPGGPLSVEQI